MPDTRILAAALLAACAAAPSAPDPGTARWRELPTGSDASLRGLSVRSAEVCWASGTGGTVLRTVDGGRTWRKLPVPGGESLDFRDVEALDDDTALVMSAGAPARIYRTGDGGRNWTLVHEDPRPGAFFDGMAFADRAHGCAFGDPVDGAFVVLVTQDGGRSWRAVAPEALPTPGDGEAGFAASGSNLCARGQALWIVTGGTRSRCLSSRDGGASFGPAPLPLRQGAPSQGAFSVAFADDLRGVAVGGDHREPDAGEGTAAFTIDGGAHWQPSATGALGYRSGVAWLPGGSCVAVGERGGSFSRDGGRSWQPLPGPGFHAVCAGPHGSVCAAGSGGRVARLEAAPGPRADLEHGVDLPAAASRARP
jgi:photosystem II stability/assembly factor-like uncharacterized protein